MPFLLHILLTVEVCAQGIHHYPGQMFTVDNGLSQSSVYQIIQDSTGYVWAGTGDGLNRITPQGITIFKTDFNQTSGLSDRTVRGLLEGENGKIWIGTDGGGLDYFNKKNGLFKKFKADGRPGSLSDNAILSAYRDKQGDLWFGSYAGGLNRYLPETQTFEVFEFDAHDSTSLGGNDVRAIMRPLTDGKFWMKLLGVMMIISVLWAWVPIWLGVLLFQAAGAAEEASAGGDVAAATRATDKLRLFFMIQGILMLIALVIVGLVFLLGGFAMLAGMAGMANA